MWTVPFVVFGLARYMLLVQTQKGGGSPTRVLLGGDLLFLSARPYQASAGAELEAATDRVERGTWTEEQAVRSVSPDRLQAMLHPSLREGHAARPVATGLGVSPGPAVRAAEISATMAASGPH